MKDPLPKNAMAGGSPWMGMVLLLSLLVVPACIKQRCYGPADCPASQTCLKSGVCGQCDETHPCSLGFQCVDHRCILSHPAPSDAQQPITCPADMVKVADTFCVDTLEASRPDATSTNSGKDGSRAVSAVGVLPWQVDDNATAEAACQAAGKRLCAPEEWRLACTGPQGTAYSYGDKYDLKICNGIDAFGPNGFTLAPTGSFPGCTNDWGVFDMNGNLWEHVSGGSDMTIRGGAFNCMDSAKLHRCDYVPGNWTPSARGFRCCLTPRAVDAGVDAIGEDAAPGDGAGATDGGGCVTVQDAEPGAEVSTDLQSHEVGGLDTFTPDGFVGLDTSRDETRPAEADAALPDAPQACPDDMVRVGAICVDRWEASRSDATARQAGTNQSIAVSRPGVLPWYVNPMSASALDQFQAACQAADKRLCTSAEWLDTCRGPGRSTYFFGDVWNPATCNSVDTYCQECCDILGLSSCPTGENCGYASVLTSSYTPETCSISADYGRDTCHVCYHVMPTGAFPQCTSRGLFDVNGNVWEVVTSSDDGRGYQVRGGAFNCGSPSARFECSFNATWSDLYAGFRCCKDIGL